MIEVTATEFAKNFGRYKEAAQREPVAITSHGRTSGVFVSAQEYAELQRLRALELSGAMQALAEPGRR